MNERCPICYKMSLVVHQDENEKSHGRCTDCGYSTDADDCRETPLGEQIDGGADEFFADEFQSHHDDDPNPYAGTYSEE